MKNMMLDDLYIVVATGKQARRERADIWEATWQFPTFFVQAASGEEATAKAEDILNHNGDIETYLDVRKVEEA